MKNKVLWGERHNGILVNPEKNKPLYDKINKELNKLIASLELVDYSLTGRIKDAGMLEGKKSRCTTEHDFLTVQYEELGFRIVINDENSYAKVKLALEKNADFTKDYVSEPRKDGIILGVDPKLCYRAFHVYTKEYFEKPIEIQVMTKDMLEMNNYLTKKYGPYWKQEDFKKKRVELGDNR